MEKNVPLRALPRTHRPSTSEGMPHPRNFLSGFPVSPSYPFILAFFFFFPTFWGTGFLSFAQLPLYLYTILKFLSAEFPQVLNLFFTPFHFPELCLSLAWRLWDKGSLLLLRRSSLYNRLDTMAQTNGELEHSKGVCWPGASMLDKVHWNTTWFRVKQDAGHTS